MKILWSKIDEVDNCNNKLMKYRVCPICKEDNTKLLLSLEKFQFFSDSTTPKQVDINEKQCKSCGAIYLNPCYSNEGFSVLFEEAGMSYGSSEGRPFEQVEWLNNYELLEDGYKVLDIGCGVGNFLASLPLNIKKVGVDIDNASIEKAREKNNDIEFICSGFDDFTYDGDIDVITMYHVLEHLPNPLETLQNLNKLSNEKTKLVVEVPIIENGNTNDINGFFSVQHLTHFSRNSLKNILVRSGWNILAWLEQKDYNGCRVLVEKTSDISNLLSYSYKEYSNVYNYLSFWYASLEKVENILSQLDTKKCIIWGGGMHLEFIYQVTSLFKNEIEFIIVDSDKNKQNKKWRGINIYSPEILETLNDDIPLVVSSYGGQSSIEKAAMNIGIKQNNIIKLYEYLRVY